MPRIVMATPGRWHLSERLVLPGILAFTFAVWGRSLSNGFVFDDLLNVVGNRWITGWPEVLEAFTHHAAGFDPAFNTSFYRPLMHVYYALTYAAAGLRPWAFHLVNVVFHVLAVALVFVLSRSVVRRWSDDARYRFLPAIAALVFSIHPAHTEPVAWVAGITDLSYTVFGLASLLVYIRSLQDSRPAWLSGLLLLASILSKETGVVVLLLMVLLEGIESRTYPRWSMRAAAIRLAPAVGLAAAYLGLRLAALGSFAPSAQQHPHNMTELLATAAALFAHYIATLIAPLDQNVMRPVAIQTGFGNPATVVGLLAGAAVLALIVVLRRSPLALLAIAVATLPLLPALYVPAIESGGSLFGERYLYLPVASIGWCLGLILEELRHRYARGRSAALALLVAVLTASSAVVIARNKVWADSLSFWTAAVAESPAAAVAHEGYCFALYSSSRFAEALGSCETAVALDPTRVSARINYGSALLATGRAREAKKVLDDALSLQPRSHQAWVNRGLACMALGQTHEALSSYARALEIAPEFAEAHNDLGVALVLLGRPAEGRRHIEQAVRFAPDNLEYKSNLETFVP